jgi:hypothetical protein
MNTYPSWIHRIPEMIEALELVVADRIDRQTIENLFDLRKTAAFHLLRRLGAERCGHSLVIPRARLMARLRELQEHPDWRWERERHEHIRERIDDLHPSPRRSLVPLNNALRQQIDQVTIAGLPNTIQFAPGRLSICCRNMEHLVDQLVLLAKALDSDYEGMQLRVESAPARNPVDREHATRSDWQAVNSQSRHLRPESLPTK